MSDPNSVIAHLLARHAAYQAEKAREKEQEVKTEHVAKSDKPVKVKASKGEKSPKASKATEEAPKGFSPTIVGRREKIDAATFERRMISVRFVTPEGRHGSRAPDRAEKIQNIADFLGSYVEQEGDTYGTIEQRAYFEVRRQKGQVIVGQDRREVRSAQASVGGFVSGVADAKEKLLASLKGREREAVENMIAAANAGDKDAVAIETARLKSIRQDLATL